MRDFTTDANLNITTDKNEAAYLFEHVDTYANGYRMLVQEKNDDGLWGGRGNDLEFTVNRTTQTREVVLNHYKQVVAEMDSDLASVEECQSHMGRGLGA